MRYDEFAADLPSNRTTVFTSAEENEEALHRLGVHQEVRQLGKGRFRSHLALRSTEQADLFADRFSTGISIRLEPPTGTAGFLFPRTANGRFLASGHDVGNSKLIVLPPGSETDIVASDLVGSEAFAIPEERFTEMSELLCPTSARLDGTAVIQGDTAHLHKLQTAVLDLIARPELGPDDEQVSNLVAQTVAWAGRFSSPWRPERITVSGARGRVARQAREFLHDHFREAVRIDDLCRETGVGVRTLQRCFREYFDVTITEYLKTLRLDAARRQLMAADPSHGLVTAIALQHGFGHLGRFSIEFRERFGESPRQTLARSRAVGTTALIDTSPSG